ncbi:hypothetical protein G9A89_000461 [Geosiphon pyriformis]|nr:hypothetical protein G9A89_000461 [Geosiphon pyriformis]
MDFSDQILKLSKQLFETIQKLTFQIEITINKKEIRVQLELNISSPTHHLKGNVGGKIAFGWEVENKKAKNEKKLEKIKEALVRKTELPKTGEWTPNNAQE